MEPVSVRVDSAFVAVEWLLPPRMLLWPVSPSLNSLVSPLPGAHSALRSFTVGSWGTWRPDWGLNISPSPPWLCPQWYLGHRRCLINTQWITDLLVPHWAGEDYFKEPLDVHAAWTSLCRKTTLIMGTLCTSLFWALPGTPSSHTPTPFISEVPSSSLKSLNT